MCERLFAAPRNQNHLFQFKSLAQDLGSLKEKNEDFQEFFNQTVQKLISTCEILELLKHSEQLASADQAIESFSYLTMVNEDMIWQFYQPALEYVFVNESEQGEIDKETVESLQRMRFKWLNSRVTNIEKTLSNCQLPASLIAVP